MRTGVSYAAAALIGVCLLAARIEPVGAAPAAAGAIKGHVRLNGPATANSLIRMGADPLCAAAARARGVRPVQEVVLRAADGGLGNAFVDLQGVFAPTPIPKTAVQIDQQGCIYGPRVIGARTGQTLQIRNGDTTVHNVHSLSTSGNDFNVSQPAAGIMSRLTLKHAETMLRLRCDIHRWMIAYVGVVNHPYFAVSDSAGSFMMANVPAGTYTIRAWHERYGPITQKVQVTPGGTATVELAYSGTESPASNLRDVTLPAGGSAIRLQAAEQRPGPYPQAPLIEMAGFNAGHN